MAGGVQDGAGLSIGHWAATVWENTEWIPPCDGEMEKRMSYRGKRIIEMPILGGVFQALFSGYAPGATPGPDRREGPEGFRTTNVTSAREPI